MKQLEQRAKPGKKPSPTPHSPGSSGLTSLSSHLLDMQEKAGNAAVTAMLLDVQRATAVKVAGGEAREDQDLAVELADEVFTRALWDSDWRKPVTDGLTPIEHDMVWDFYNSATNHAFSPGAAAGPGTSLKDLDSGEHKLDALQRAYHVRDRKRRQTEREHYRNLKDNVAKWRVRLLAEVATGRAEAGEVDVPGLDPKEAGEQKRLLEAIEKSLENGHAIGEGAHKLGEAIELEHEWPKAMERLEVANDVLKLSHLLLSTADPHKRREYINELRKQLGQGPEHSGVGATASVTEAVKAVLEGASIAEKIHLKWTGYFAKQAGQLERAKECFEAAEKLGKTMDVIIGAIEVVHGVLVLADPKASGEKKVEAGIEVATGSAGLLAAAGVISTTAATAFGISVTVTWYEFKWVMTEVGSSVIGGSMEYELRQSYASMREKGNELARRKIVLDRLMEMEKGAPAGPEKQGMLLAIQDAKLALYEAIYDAANSWRGAPQRALSSRYAMETGLVPMIEAAAPANADPAVVDAAATLLLQGMMSAAQDFPRVNRQNFRDHGYEVAEPEAEEEEKTESLRDRYLERVVELLGPNEGGGVRSEEDLQAVVARVKNEPAFAKANLPDLHMKDIDDYLAKKRGG